MIKNVLKHEKEVTVIGGDHSCAIGTWSGVAKANLHRGPVGLIWVDAHMDAHTPTTSPTGNLHGMPVAHLLGYGDPRLTEIFGLCPKIRPQNLALVGIRSFEAEERELLEKLKVKIFLRKRVHIKTVHFQVPIFYDEDIQKRGLKAVMNDALTVVNDGTDCFGMSIDVDAFQIQDAPGTGTPENGGIVAAEFLNYLKTINYQRHIATEIVEFMPEKDDEVKTTEKLVVNLLEAIYLTKFGERK